MYFTNIKPAIKRPYTFHHASFGSPSLLQKPLYNVKQNDQEWVIEIALPGFSKEEIQMEIKQDLLSIVATPSKDKTIVSDAKLYHHEFKVAEKKIQFHLNDKMNAGEITAKLDNGVLYIQIPSTIPATPQAVRIEVQ